MLIQICFNSSDFWFYLGTEALFISGSLILEPEEILYIL